AARRDAARRYPACQNSAVKVPSRSTIPKGEPVFGNDDAQSKDKRRIRNDAPEPDSNDRPRSKLRGPEGVAGADRACLEADVELGLALPRSAVGETVRHYASLRAALEHVVADRRRGLDRRVDIARNEEAVLPLGVIGPDAGYAIGLKLDPHLQPV